MISWTSHSSSHDSSTTRALRKKQEPFVKLEKCTQEESNEKAQYLVKEDEPQQGKPEQSCSQHDSTLQLHTSAEDELETAEAPATPTTPTQNTVGTRVPTLNNPKHLQQNYPLYTKRTPTLKKTNQPTKQKSPTICHPLPPLQAKYHMPVTQKLAPDREGPSPITNLPRKTNHSLHPTNQPTRLTRTEPL